MINVRPHLVLYGRVDGFYSLEFKIQNKIILTTNKFINSQFYLKKEKQNKQKKKTIGDLQTL